MTRTKDKSLEDLIKRFGYIKRENLHHLGSNTLKICLLRTIRDEWVDLLDLMNRVFVYQLSFEEFCET